MCARGPGGERGSCSTGAIRLARAYRLSLVMACKRVAAAAADLGPVRVKTACNAQHVIRVFLQFSLAKPPDILAARRAFLFASLPVCATNSQHECAKGHRDHESLPNRHLGISSRDRPSNGSPSDREDRTQIELMAAELPSGDLWERREPRLRAMTRMLVRRHKARITRVAKALLSKTAFTAEQLDKLVGKSIDDVNVNAPFLLAMHRLGDLQR
jgi:hypothetical protein